MCFRVGESRTIEQRPSRFKPFRGKRLAACFMAFWIVSTALRFFRSSRNSLSVSVTLGWIEGVESVRRFNYAASAVLFASTEPIANPKCPCNKHKAGDFLINKPERSRKVLFPDRRVERSTPYKFPVPQGRHRGQPSGQRVPAGPPVLWGTATPRNYNSFVLEPHILQAIRRFVVHGLLISSTKDREAVHPKSRVAHALQSLAEPGTNWWPIEADV